MSPNIGINTDAVVAAGTISESTNSSIMEEGGVDATGIEKESSSFFSNSSTEGSNNNNSASQTADPTSSIPLVQRDTRWLSNARMLMMFILFVAMGSSAIGTHLFMLEIERDDFRTRVSNAKVPLV